MAKVHRQCHLFKNFLQLLNLMMALTKQISNNS